MHEFNKETYKPGGGGLSNSYGKEMKASLITVANCKDTIDMLGMICSELHRHWGLFSHLFYIKIMSCLGVHRCVMVQVKSKLKIAFFAGR